MEEKILNNATLKKTLNDSIAKARELLVVKRNILHQNRVEINKLEKDIQKEKKRFETMMKGGGSWKYDG